MRLKSLAPTLWTNDLDQSIKFYQQVLASIV